MQAQSNEKHDEKAALVRRWIEEGWNKGHTEVASEIFAPDYVHHEAVTPAVNDRKGAARSLPPLHFQTANRTAKE